MTKGVKKTRSSAKKAKPVATIHVAPEPTTSDQKILWGRAAGRCAWCTEKLTLDRDAEPAVTLGEMCHIVGEKSKAARGNEGLPMSDRGRYTNLILLCRHHHIIIDRYEKKYTVAILHEMKDAHERLVEDKLAQTPDPDDAVYADVIDTVSRTLPFDKWRWFTDHALRMMVDPEMVESRGILNAMMLKTLWPGKFPALEKAVEVMVKAFDAWITLYAANAELLSNSKVMRPNRGYRRGSLQQRLEEDEEENDWANACYSLFADFVAKLNMYAHAVRQTVNPLYQRREGKFLIFDDMGVWHGNQPAIVEPRVETAAKMIAKYFPPVQKRLLT